MRGILLLIVVGLLAFSLVGPLGEAPSVRQTPTTVQAPTFGPAAADQVEDHDYRDDHQGGEDEWCRQSIGDTDGDGYAEQVPCDPETRAAASAALDRLHGGSDQSRLVP